MDSWYIVFEENSQQPLTIASTLAEAENIIINLCKNKFNIDEIIKIDEPSENATTFIRKNGSDYTLIRLHESSYIGSFFYGSKYEEPVFSYLVKVVFGPKANSNLNVDVSHDRSLVLRKNSEANASLMTEIRQAMEARRKYLK